MRNKKISVRLAVRPIQWRGQCRDSDKRGAY